jgi:hypothetical protein
MCICARAGVRLRRALREQGLQRRRRVGRGDRLGLELAVVLADARDVWYGMVWYGGPPTPRQCVLSLRMVASCSVDPSGHSGQ